MLNGTLTLHDIRDVEAYCTNILQRTNHPHDEDTLAYLIATTWELSLTYQPGRLSFSTWAGTTLRQRLNDHTRTTKGRTVWRFKNRTYTRTLPTITSLDDPHARQPEPTPHGDPAADRDTDRLVRLLRSRSSDEAWRDHSTHTPPKSRAA